MYRMYSKRRGVQFTTFKVHLHLLSDLSEETLRVLTENGCSFAEADDLRVKWLIQEKLQGGPEEPQRPRTYVSPVVLSPGNSCAQELNHIIFVCSTAKGNLTSSGTMHHGVLLVLYHSYTSCFDNKTVNL